MTGKAASKAERHTCVRCDVRFRPEHTDGECPICRTVAPGHAGRSDDDGGDLRATIVVGMSAVNLLFLGGLAMLFLR